MFKNKHKEKKRIQQRLKVVKEECFDFDSIKAYFQKKDQSGVFQVISDRTCEDLDFDEFFMFADRTVSRVGQQFLYNQLRTVPERNLQSSTKNEKLIQILNEDEGLIVDIQYELKGLRTKDAYNISSLFQDEHIERPKCFFLFPLLSMLSVVLILLTFINNACFLLLLPIFLINVGIHYWNKRNVFQYIVAIPQLLKMNLVAGKLSKYQVFKTKAENCRESIKVINKIGKRMSFFRLEAKLESEMSMILWGILELIKTVFLIESLLLFSVIKQIENKRDHIYNVFSFVGFTDSLVSISLFRKSLPLYCIPVKAEHTQIRGNNIYHPLIPDCISNSIHQCNKSVLLTGSNMSGKTTFIRTVGLNVLSGLTMNTCFASSFSFSSFKLFSAIRISDDLMNNKSYYFEEVQTIKRMIDEAGGDDDCLFLLDEIFKGTNTIERISAGKAVLSELNRNKNLVFVSSHDVELADLLKDDFELFHFCEVVQNNDIIFDYKLKEGPVKEGNAIKMLEVLGYPASVIQEAFNLSMIKLGVDFQGVSKI